LVNDRKALDEITWLRKKVENLSNVILTLKNEEMSPSNNKMSGSMDNSKYLEAAEFHEFERNSKKELENLRRGIEDLKIYIEDILSIMKAKVNDKDLKNLEGKVNLII